MTINGSSNTLPSDARLLVDVDSLRAGVDARLANILREQSDTLGAISVDSALLVDAWRVLLSGGKRLRAAFAYWGYRVISPDTDLTPKTQESLYRVGAALELFQAAALFHDDVMDRSDTRRGNTTAHRAFEKLHVDNQFVGDSAHYGVSTAILLGDLSLVESEKEFREASYAFPEEARLNSHKIFDLMRSTVTVGQFLDVHAQVAPWNTEGDYSTAKERAYNIIRTKTSSYSVTHPLLAGAALAGASEEQLRVLEEFAMPVGIAYQLFDDLLGVFGDPETTGKPAGDDLREGKRTVLVLEALERLSNDDRIRLQNALGDATLSDSHVSELISLIASSGARSATEEIVANLAAQGLSHLDQPYFNPRGVEMLKAITGYALKRNF